MTNPKTHRCVTCKAFNESELRQFSRLLGQSTAGKSRTQLCTQVQRIVKGSNFDKLIRRSISRQKRVSAGRRRAASGDLFRPKRPIKTVQQWAEENASSSSPFVGTAGSYAVPTAPPNFMQRIFGGNASPVPNAPAWTGYGSSSLAAPAWTGYADVDYEDYDDEYANEDSYQKGRKSSILNEFLGDDDEEDPYGEEYEAEIEAEDARRRQSYGSRSGSWTSGKDWRDLVRQGYLNDASPTVGDILRLQTQSKYDQSPPSSELSKQMGLASPPPKRALPIARKALPAVPERKAKVVDLGIYDDDRLPEDAFGRNFERSPNPTTADSLPILNSEGLHVRRYSRRRSHHNRRR